MNQMRLFSDEILTEEELDRIERAHAVGNVETEWKEVWGAVPFLITMARRLKHAELELRRVKDEAAQRGLHLDNGRQLRCSICNETMTGVCMHVVKRLDDYDEVAVRLHDAEEVFWGMEHDVPEWGVGAAAYQARWGERYKR